MTTYPNTTLVILAGNCGDDGEAFRDWVAQKYPEINVDFRARTSGVGGGHYDEDGEEIDSRLWEEFCNSYVED